MSAFPPPPPKQSSCANCARELLLKLVPADNGRRYWLCGGCEAGMRKRNPFGAEVVRLPINRFSENSGPRPPTPGAPIRAPTMDEQERRALRSAAREPEDRPVRGIEPSFEEEIDALKRRWGTR